MTATPAPQPPNAFRTANPHALSIIVEASETKRIIAATDIFDISGIKLWASQQPVSAELQRVSRAPAGVRWQARLARAGWGA